jgi:hypothetical protein
MTFFIWKTWWRVELAPMTEPQEISFNDMLIFAYVAIDLIQYAAMGPDFKSLNAFIATVGYAVSVDLEKLIGMEDGLFWVVLAVVLAA